MLATVFLALLASQAYVALAQALDANFPNPLPQCAQVDLSWSGGQGPFAVQTIPNIRAPSDTIVQHDWTSDTSPISWTVDYPTGTLVILQVKDSTGAVISQNRQVSAGDSSCLPATGGSPAVTPEAPEAAVTPVSDASQPTSNGDGAAPSPSSEVPTPSADTANTAVEPASTPSKPVSGPSRLDQTADTASPATSAPGAATNSAGVTAAAQQAGTSTSSAMSSMSLPHSGTLAAVLVTSAAIALGVAH